MAWYDALADVISKNPDLLPVMRNSNEMVSQINTLLLQVQRDPSSASQVATAIATMDGCPAVVRDLASNLPQAAKDQSGITMTMLISQIQSALPRSRWF